METKTYDLYLPVYYHGVGNRDKPLHVEARYHHTRPTDANDYTANLFNGIVKSWTFPAPFSECPEGTRRTVCHLRDFPAGVLDLRVWLGEDSYAVGDPFGFVNGVDASEDLASSGEYPAVELTETSPVFARLDLYAGTDDRVLRYGDDGGDVPWSTEEGSVGERDTAVASLTKAEHVRIVPYMISGVKQDTATTADGREFVELVGIVTNRVVAEFDVDSANKCTLTEADFIRDGKFDIDWDSFTSEIRNNSLVSDAVGDVTAVKYRIVLGREGPVGKESSSDETSAPARAYATLIERRFELVTLRTLPTQLATDAIQYGVRPTFRWRLDEPAGVSGYAASSARLGCTYTAFQLQVKDGNGDVVYDTGELRAPPRDADGAFVWTAPFAIGDTVGEDVEFTPAANWMWRVAMHNAKFKPSTSDDRNGWSAYSVFEFDDTPGPGTVPEGWTINPQN